MIVVKRKQIEVGFGMQWCIFIVQFQLFFEGVDWLKDVCWCEVIILYIEDNVMNEQVEGCFYWFGQIFLVQCWRFVIESIIDDEVYLNNLVKCFCMGLLYWDKMRKGNM